MGFSPGLQCPAGAAVAPGGVERGEEFHAALPAGAFPILGSKGRWIFCPENSWGFHVVSIIGSDHPMEDPSS